MAETRETPAGLVVVEGGKEVHLLAATPRQLARAHVVAEEMPFRVLFRHAKAAPRLFGRHIRFMRIGSA